MDVNQPIVAIIHEFKRITMPIKGIENLHLFNYKNYRSLIYYWFEREIIPKELIIMSDKVQTKDGYKFWQNIFDQYVIKNKTHKMFVIDYISGKNVGDIINKDNMNNYYGNDTYRFRFVLEKL